MTQTGKVNWYGAQFLAEVRDATPDALFEGAEQLKGAAASRAPHRSGRLADSAYAASASKNTYRKIGRGYRRMIKPGPGQAVAAFSAPHAHLLEYGTVKMAARPFLRPAFDELKGKIGATIVASMKRKVNK